ncbi:MAG: putative prokaryotic signal transducing protein [Planctomycetota bacterium]
MVDGRDIVELTKMPDEASASMLVARLEQEGIPASVTSVHSARLFLGVFGLPIVVVRRSDFDRATLLLKAEALPDGWEDEAEQMPREGAHEHAHEDAHEDTHEDAPEDSRQ